jgi:hypothetical protein
MHHYGFLRGSIVEDKDEFHLVLFNAETKGELMISGKISKTFNIREEGIPTVEFCGNVIADALNDATHRGGGALT